MDISIAAFLGGMVVFFGTHLFSAFRKRGPDDIKARMGGAYMGLYSLISIVGFAAMIWGYATAKPWMAVWAPPLWTRHIPISLMPFSAVLMAAAYAPTGYIKKVVKHPMLVSVKLWAVVHLAANGDLASIILFGGFLLFAGIDRIALAMRGDKGPADAKPSLVGDMLAISIGLGVYVVIVFWLHVFIAGVPVIT